MLLHDGKDNLVHMSRFDKRCTIKKQQGKQLCCHGDRSSMTKQTMHSHWLEQSKRLNVKSIWMGKQSE